MTRQVSVPYSVVIGTIQGWPEIRATIRSLEAAVARVGGEVLVFDGSGQPPPGPGELGDFTQWTSAPSTSVFQGRYEGYRAARGNVIAITEDHCLVPPDWAERMIEAHRRHPEAAAIGGSVENAADDRIIDWASFLIVQYTVMAPIRSGPATRLSGAVNVSYKRTAIDSLVDHEGLGAMDVLHQRMLAERGETLIADDRIRVAHDQPLGFREATVIHFHAGRTMSGFRRQAMGPVDWVRFVGAFLVPWARFARIATIGARKGYGRQLAAGLPAILWLLYSQAVGQFIGYARGAGDSASQLQ